MLRGKVGKWVVFAFQDEGGANPGEPVVADQANITANLRLDGSSANAIDDTNPALLEDGYYIFDLTAAETDADNIVICPVSATANVNVIGCPPALYTFPAQLNASAQRIIEGYAVKTGTLTTSAFSTTLNDGSDYNANDALIGRTIIFDGNTTAALKDQSSVINDYVAVNGVVNIATALTVAPANTDTFIIV